MRMFSWDSEKKKSNADEKTVDVFVLDVTLEFDEFFRDSPNLNKICIFACSKQRAVHGILLTSYILRLNRSKSATNAMNESQNKKEMSTLDAVKEVKDWMWKIKYLYINFCCCSELIVTRKQQNQAHTAR